MTTKPLIALCCLGLLAAASGRCSAQTDRMAPGPPHETNLELGQLPPSTFALPSAIDGTLFDLAEQRGERPILLLFFRGTW